MVERLERARDSIGLLRELEFWGAVGKGHPGLARLQSDAEERHRMKEQQRRDDKGQESALLRQDLQRKEARMHEEVRAREESVQCEEQAREQSARREGASQRALQDEEMRQQEAK